MERKKKNPELYKSDSNHFLCDSWVETSESSVRDYSFGDWSEKERERRYVPEVKAQTSKAKHSLHYLQEQGEGKIKAGKKANEGSEGPLKAP